MNLPKLLTMPVRTLYRNIALGCLAFALLGDAVARGVPDRIFAAYKDWQYERSRTPESVLQSLRGHETQRLSADADKNKWLLLNGDGIDSLLRIPEGVLVVRVTTDKATTSSEARQVVCSLLSPPMNLKQELFSEVRIWNKWEPMTATSTWVMAMEKEGCQDGRGNEAVCSAYKQIAVTKANIERSRFKLPADPAQFCSDGESSTDARGKTSTVTKHSK
jgi:hypothetical protein